MKLYFIIYNHVFFTDKPDVFIRIKLSGKGFSSAEAEPGITENKDK